MLTPELVAIVLAVILSAGVLVIVNACMAASSRGQRRYEEQMFAAWRAERDRLRERDDA